MGYIILRSSNSFVPMNNDRARFEVTAYILRFITSYFYQQIKATINELNQLFDIVFIGSGYRYQADIQKTFIKQGT